MVRCRLTPSSAKHLPSDSTPNVLPRLPRQPALSGYIPARAGSRRNTIELTINKTAGEKNG
jgi:hypothetical protein